MANEKKKKPSIDPDVQFENRIFPCHSVKIFRSKDIVQVLIGKEVKRNFRLSSFPDELDLNSIDTIASLINTVEKDGHEGLRKKYKLKAVNK